MSDTCFVYMYVRSRSSENGLIGTPYYIGKGRGRRDLVSRHGVPIPKDRTFIVRVADGMSEVDAFQAEMLLIHRYGRLDIGSGCLRNRSDGGEGPSGHIRTAEHRRNLSIALRGISIEIRNKYSEVQRNRPIEHTLKIAAALKGRPMLEHVKAKLLAANLGSSHSPEHRRKQSDALRGRTTGPFSDERRRRISEAGMGRKHTEEAKRKIGKAVRTRMGKESVA